MPVEPRLLSAVAPRRCWRTTRNCRAGGGRSSRLAAPYPEPRLLQGSRAAR
ncbi:hypothetical protein LV779_08445 [Streptomyces thinghirensis]|nr:hypothetical protein [Streptomyces thinghirensis]